MKEIGEMINFEKIKRGETRKREKERKTKGAITEEEKL